ncbi:TOTE conflict system archaeo-eukaryotic primase domain-containing protein [Haloimpatiens massiliensis]|uniref:TOTE conflict system archaeo-eukaryotic primase domain-containing protein n=1 Tax=Haloimpatiens massiliensis TaxID=1658110 RepID=UPI001FA87264|nr:DEAD/DEAH box helicase family protein [Haloimpatiens massiliensis]
MDYNELLEKYKLLQRENELLRAEIVKLNAKFIKYFPAENCAEKIYEAIINYGDKNVALVTNTSLPQEKIDLFLNLFRGRENVCAKRWKNKPGYSPFCFNDFRLGICSKPKIKCTECKNSKFAPLNSEQLKKHLMGKEVLGLYPMTEKDTCYLLVMDLDEARWQDDSSVIRNVCVEKKIPVYVERSRSGQGCHIWFFFDVEIKAYIARKFGMIILNLAMQQCGEIKFDSYDRLFPSQDFLQKNGFGNLIALPLQKEARVKNNSVFVDENFNAFKDQWVYLSQIEKLSEKFVLNFIKTHKISEDYKENKIIEHMNNKEEIKVQKVDFPEKIIIKRCNGITICKEGISPKGLFALRKMASYLNPEFYLKQAMRQSTYKISRVTVMYEENESDITIPRGLETKLINLLSESSINYSIIDNKIDGRKINVSFKGKLKEKQQLVFEEMNKFENGVLSATTGFGKTVIGARIIAEKKTSTLILVHTKELATQWKERLEQFLEIDEEIEGNRRKASIIGQLGGGKKSLNGVIDIAIMQSMFEKDKSIKSLINQYGLVLVDECHHISASNFNRILSYASARYVYGLTATPIRKDGHHPIIFMQCGPIRYKVDAKQEAKQSGFDHFIVPRFTSTRMPINEEDREWHITEIYQHICDSNYRNALIVKDIEAAINAGRNTLVLTERTSHINVLVNMLSGKDFQIIVLSGELSAQKRKAALDSIKALSNGDRYVIVATGKLIGEGFDEARLDTLFMTMPIAWKGTIAQYAGRLHRSYEGKNEVIIYDYVDVHIPVLERMYHKRLTAYRTLGYSIKNNIMDSEAESGIYDNFDYFEHVLKDIAAAKKNILVSSPFLQKKKINVVKETLVDKYKSGIRITLCIKEVSEYSDKQQRYIIEFIEEMQKQGINVVQIKHNRYRFMIVDYKIVWYGGIDIFGGTYDDNSLIRVQNEELANELIGVVAEIKSNKE